MRLNPVDKYAKKSNFCHIDPRAKLVGIIVFVVTVAILQDALTLVLSLIFIVSILAISNVPAHHIIKRYIVALPFIIFAAVAIYISHNYISSLSIFLRISSCVLGLIVLSSTTPFFDLLKGMQKLKIPNIFVVMLMFTYRYFFVFIDEMERMKLARKARGFHGGKHLFEKHGMKTISYTAGMVLVRAYERGVRIYDALLARGYEGKMKTLNPLRTTRVDFGFCFIFVLISIFLIYYDWIVW
jgi:cobalt/nickel transport system permease protein